MDLLRMVIREQEKSCYSPKKPILEPFIKGSIPKHKAPVNIDYVHQRNEKIAQRREKINHRIVSLELRVDVLLDEVQRVKKKYKAD